MSRQGTSTTGLVILAATMVLTACAVGVLVVCRQAPVDSPAGNDAAEAPAKTDTSVPPEDTPAVDPGGEAPAGKPVFLIETLENPDARLRHAAAIRLLSGEGISAEELLPAVHEALRRIIDGEVETLARWKGKDVLPLVRLTAKYPARTSVPVLLSVAERPDLTVMEGDHVVSTDGRVLPMKNPKHIFADVARALSICTDGAIGTVGEERPGYAARKKLIADWNAWWEAHKDDEH